MESSDSTQSNVPLDSAKIMQFKVMLQVYTAFKEWQERSGAGLMLTQHKLVIDLAIQNMDRPIHFQRPWVLRILWDLKNIWYKKV